MKKISANDWFNFRKEKKIIIWFEYVDDLQKQLNSSYLRTMNVNYRMKQCKQLSDQSITELISYINLLKKQFSVFFTKYMQYANLLKILHLYFKNAIMRQIIFIIIWNEFEKLTRFFEKNESMSNKLKNQTDVRKNKKNNRKNKKYNSYFKNSKLKKF